jgi:putative flippase GtrA
VSSASASPAGRAIRYGVVGAAAFAIDLGFLLALAPHLPLLAANTLAFLAANVFNFWAGHVWVFRRPLSGPGLGRQYAAVLAISVAGLALNDALVWAGVEAAGASLVVSKIIATGVAMVWNYMARALWVYKEEGVR